MSESPNPLVTIAIPNHNTAKYIGEAMESALAQTRDDFEILVINNASTDNSWQIISEMAARDSRIVAHDFKELFSALNNWNRGLALARGKYIVFLHADDLLKPDFLKTCLEIFEIRPNLGYVYCDKEYINASGESEGNNEFYRNSGIIPGLGEARVNLLGWHTVPVQMLVRTQCMREVGGYYFSDIFPTLLINLKWDIGYSREALVQYRRHAGATTQTFVDDKTLVMYLYLSKVLVLDYYLPEKAFALRELKPRIQQRFANACLLNYGLKVLGSNHQQLCREYLALASSFWLEIETTPAYRFVKEACERDDWSPESLAAAWTAAVKPITGEGPPYPLPEGSVILSSDIQ